MKTRAELLTDTFNNMTNTNCQKIEGAMYGFPSVDFSKKAMKAAENQGMAPDVMYCM